jgi:acetyl esterase/lipase
MDSLSRRDLAVLGGGLLASLATASAQAAAESSGAADPLGRVNPEYRPFFPVLRQLADMAPISASNLAERRKPMPQFASRPLATPAVAERVIPGPKGAPDVRVYIINAGQASAGKPAILHIHGGGFITGEAKYGLTSLQEIALAVDGVIVTVDYRLAPETRFPGALEDNYAALKWLYAHAAELGVDRHRIAVMGESAGGGHAAMLAIAARDRGEVPILYQALIYPMLDDRTGSTRPAPPQVGQILWRPADNRFGWTSLLGVPAGSARVPAGSVPARVENLSGLPPTFIAVGSIDLFVDEDIDYARRLIAAGVPAELHVYPDCFHGFNAFPTAITRQYNEALHSALKNAFAVERG